jgi:hypothetical protein
MRRWFIIALSNLLIVAVIGTLLRYAFVDEMPGFEFKNWLHAHSHLAMLGWVYLALVTLITEVFIPHRCIGKSYHRLLWVTQFVIWGMLLAFIRNGYDLFSIGFLSLHVLLSYVFMYLIWRNVPATRPHVMSVKLLRMSLIFQFISTLALWAMPLLDIYALRGSQYYYMAIQFFLHFQFNGWFIFCVLALFFRMLEESGVEVSVRKSHLFFVFLVASCFLTYALAVAWSNPLPIVFGINGLGVVVQFIAMVMFCVLLYPHRRVIHNRVSGNTRVFIYVALACFLLKIFVQTAVVIPFIAHVGYTIRNFVIGFIHLILLGVITMGIFGFAFRYGMLTTTARPGAILVLIGFVLVELLLFGQGMLLWAAKGFMPFYYESITIASVVIFAGALWMLLKQWMMEDG